MKVRSLNLSKCGYCGNHVECVVEDLGPNRYYTARCNCAVDTLEISHNTLETLSSTNEEEYCYELVWQRLKSRADQEHMKNPGSREETGVDSDTVWDAVIRAMLLSYYKGITYANHGDVHDNLTRKELEEILKSRLDKVIDNPPDDLY